MPNTDFRKLRELSLRAFAKQDDCAVGLPSVSKQRCHAARRVARAQDYQDIAEERILIRQGDDLSAAMTRRAELLQACKSEHDLIDFDPASIYLIHGLNSSTPDFGTEFDKLPKRLERAARNKARANQMACYIWDTHRNTAQKLATCNTIRIFREWYETGDTRLVCAFCCKQDKLCPVCANLRAGRNAAKAYPKILAQLSQNKHYREYLITLTVKDGSSLLERLTHLKSNLKILVDHIRKYRNGKGRHKFMEFCRIAGGIYSIEITIGKNSGQWHPHVHIYVLADSEIQTVGTRCPEMENWWLQRTGDSFIVDCRPITSEQRGGAIVEVLKYSAKFSSMTLAQNYEAWHVCTQGAKSLRLQGSIGCLRGLPQVKVLTDPLSEDEGDFIDHAFRFDPVSNIYRETTFEPVEGETFDSRILEQVGKSGTAWARS